MVDHTQNPEEDEYADAPTPLAGFAAGPDDEGGDGGGDGSPEPGDDGSDDDGGDGDGDEPKKISNYPTDV
jgi:hypothetical protein